MRKYLIQSPPISPPHMSYSLWLWYIFNFTFSCVTIISTIVQFYTNLKYTMNSFFYGLFILELLIRFILLVFSHCSFFVCSLSCSKEVLIGVSFSEFLNASEYFFLHSWKNLAEFSSWLAFAAIHPFTQYY